MKPSQSQKATSHTGGMNLGQLCPHCAMHFNTVFDLKTHISWVHGHLLPYRCKECGRGYNTSGGLHLHKKTHKGVFYRCPICLLRFVQKSSVKRHMINLHGDSHTPIERVHDFTNTFG
ncbi:Zinc finger protein 782 [Plakobranchus ocellatus]|uniref:Zinc finger protein 782 n=1 Tax=Plakobranchus ocellatus TaxID=259542 RepID=A0AAV3YDQ5_9GAST|nr:Zinc finger protein 782 [Plakobranchus ocellatus]